MATLAILVGSRGQIKQECCICGELTDKTAIRHPCRHCSSHWCISCLKNLFVNTIGQKGAFSPPRCCAIIQLHTVLDCLATQLIDEYRKKFKEWLTKDKVYCPVPTCSAFIDTEAVRSPELDTSASLQCPECASEVCGKCRQLAHQGSCDTKAMAEEKAMLARLKIKQCPRCRRAVRKMLGCPHIECICGAHFCFSCGESTSLCHGGCVSERDDEEGESDEEEIDIRSEPGDEEDKTKDASGAREHHGSFRQADNQRIDPHHSDLDAGGEARWATASEDFGNEPEEEPAVQIWSCEHDFLAYRPIKDGYHRGDLGLLECNRCFSAVRAPSVEGGSSPVSKRRKLLAGPSMTQGTKSNFKPARADQAWECRSCCLVVCVGCRAKYEYEQDDE